MASRYKQTTQTVRTVFREPAPLKGMHYTDTPLEAGLGRVLINFEKNSDDTGIRPRKGAQLLDVYSCEIPETEHIKHLYFSDTLFKINKDDQKVHGIVRFVIDHYLYYSWQGAGDYSETELPTLANKPIDLNKTVANPFETDTGNTYYYTPVIINNRLVSCVSFESRDLIYLAQMYQKSAAGVVTPVKINGKFKYTLFKAKANTEDISVSEDDVAIIDPRKLNPTEAANWGFNMLLDNPYIFESKSSPVENQMAFLGFLPYESEDPKSSVVLNPICNTTNPYIFKLFTEVGVGTYAIRIRWRGVTNDAWESITPNSKYTTTEDKAIAINLNQEAVKNYNIAFNPKQEATVMQIKMYSKKDNAKPLSTAYLDSKYSFINGVKPTDTPVENGIYSEDTSILDRAAAIFKHNDKYGNTYYYELDKQNKWSYAAYPTSEDDAEEEIFAAGYRHLSTNAMSFNFVKSAEHNALTDSKFELGSANGLCYWRNRTVLWGVNNALSTIFMSDINDPSYFPFPNNICSFAEPVYHALPFQDDLLVFTKSQIWRVKLNPDGLTFTQTCIQKNLRIDEKDMQLTLALSSMVFFKAGPYFYLLVPSAKGTGDLVLAAISRTMEDVFRDPALYITKVIEALYREEVDLDSAEIRMEYPTELIEIGDDPKNYPLYFVHTYLDYDKIHIIYSSQVFVDSSKVSFNAVFNLVLSYDINLRSWHTWVFESPQVPRLIEQDVIRQGIWAGLSRYNTKYYIGKETDSNADIPIKVFLSNLSNCDQNATKSFAPKSLPLRLNTYTATDYDKVPGATVGPDKVIINKELVNDMQTFSFTNEQSRQDLLKRYITPNNVVYKCSWAVYDGIDLNSNLTFKYKPMTLLDNVDTEFRYGVITLGKPKVYEELEYNKRTAEFVGVTKESFINYTTEPQFFAGAYIDRAEIPMDFYKVQDTTDPKVYHNIFKDGINNTLIPDSYTFADSKNQKLSITRRDFITINNQGEEILTHVWYYHIAKQGTVNSTDADVDDVTAIRDAYFFRNYQYLDTGNRNIVPEVKKKFREYQLTINNKSNSPLSFYTEFVVDDISIPTLYNGILDYKPTEYVDKNKNGVIINVNKRFNPTMRLEYDLTKSVEVAGTVNDYTDFTRTEFMIDNTYYTKPFMVKLRVPTNAKGYLGHLKILSKNQVDYELNDTALVYRLQNAR